MPNNWCLHCLYRLIVFHLNSLHLIFLLGVTLLFIISFNPSEPVFHILLVCLVSAKTKGRCFGIYLRHMKDVGFEELLGGTRADSLFISPVDVV
jgi:hypothetical protein